MNLIEILNELSFAAVSMLVLISGGDEYGWKEIGIYWVSLISGVLVQVVIIIHICYAIYAIYLYLKGMKKKGAEGEVYESHDSEFEKPIELDVAENEQTKLIKDGKEAPRKEGK